MTTDVQICNRAISTYLGGARITSLTEDTENAIACNIHYDDTLRGLLERHWWNFATSRQVLAEVTNDRDEEWAFKYAVPADAIAIRWVNDAAAARIARTTGQTPDSERELAGQFFYSDIENATCEFTKLITDASVYPQYFADAMSAVLAMNIVQSITEDRVRTKRATDAADRLVQEAIALDHRNTPPIKQGVPQYLTDRGVT